MSLSPASLRKLVLTAVMALAFTGAANAQEEGPIDWKKGGKWSSLAEYIGTYNYDAVLKNKDLKAQLDKQTKGVDINLGDEFEVTAPIGFENDCLILQGSRVHKGDTNRSYLEACLFQGTVNLAVFDHGKITVYTAFKDYKYLSQGMRSWIYFQNNRPALNDKPENLQLVIEAQ